MLAWYIINPKKLRGNHWGHTKKLSAEWWKFKKINIEPIDDILNKINTWAFVHHIERLMYLGVWMFLNKISPDQVYEWFMIATIDAYEWVMVPNIYGMSQHADGGQVMRRPYICSSNYILKMSNYKRGPWCKAWDSLYWNFISTHRKYFAKSYYYASQVSILDRKGIDKLVV
jgi:deoxyribodipyrimidine photolyase-related protein